MIADCHNLPRHHFPALKAAIKADVILTLQNATNRICFLTDSLSLLIIEGPHHDHRRRHSRHHQSLRCSHHYHNSHHYYAFQLFNGISIK